MKPLLFFQNIGIRLKSSSDQWKTLRQSRVWLFVFFSLVVGMHVAKVCKLAPLENIHLSSANMETVRVMKALRVSGQANGYDPSLFAGSPAGPLLKLDYRAVTETAAFLSKRSQPVSTILIFQLLFFCLPPLALYLAARFFGGSPTVGILAAAIATAGFGNYDPFSFGLIRAGYAAILAAPYLAVLAVSVFFKAMEGNKVLLLVVGGLLLQLLCFLDPNVVLFFIIPVFIFYGLHFRTMTLKIHALFWVLLFSVLFSQSHLIRAVVLLDPTLQISFFKWHGTRALFNSYLHIHDVSDVYPVFLRGYLLLFGLVGGIFFVPPRMRLTVTAWILLAVVLACFDPRVPSLDDAGILRFLVYLSVVIIIPASFVLVEFFIQPRTLRTLVFLWVLWYSMSWQLSSYNPIVDTAATRLQTIDNLAGQLGKLPHRGRVLIEDRWPELALVRRLQQGSGQECLGGGAPLYYNVAKYTSFAPWTSRGAPGLFGKRLADYTKDELVEALERYNVSYVVAFSLQAWSRFDRYPTLFRRTTSEGPVRLWGEPYKAPVLEKARIYKVLAYKPNYFQKGAGRVTATFNRIYVEIPVGKSRRLKYHLFDNIAAPAGIRLFPWRAARAPLAFMELDNQSASPAIVLTGSSQ